MVCLQMRACPTHWCVVFFWGGPGGEECYSPSPPFFLFVTFFSLQLLFGNYYNDRRWGINNVTAAEAAGAWVHNRGDHHYHVDHERFPVANPACAAAFQTCLGDPRYPPWQSSLPQPCDVC